MDEIQQLKQRIEVLEKILMISDKYLFQKPLVGGPNGLRLGTNNKDKIGFYAGVPVVRYDGVSFNAPAGGTYGSNEQNILNGVKDALIYYNLAHT